MKIENNQDRLLLDSRYYALFEANRVWKAAFMATPAERLDMAREVHRLRAFSLNQVAKICRLSPSTVARKLRANAPGGRFEPESLTTLMVIRKLVTDQEKIDNHLIHMVVETGTSINTIHRLTGAHAGTMYEQVKPTEGAMAA